MKCNVVCCALLFTVVVIVAASLFYPLISNRKEEYCVEILVYDFSYSFYREDIIQKINNYGKISIIKCYLDDPSCRNTFLKIITILIEEKINILPMNICVPCELHHGLNWQDIYMRRLSPLVLIFQNKRLKAIIVSEYNQPDFNELLSRQNDVAIIFLRDKNLVKLSKNAAARIESLLKDK